MAINENTALLHSHTIVYITVPKESPSDYESISSDNDYSIGLTLEELLPFKDDPWWQNLRRALLCTFGLIFIFILTCAFMLMYIHGGGGYCKILALEATSTISSAMAADSIGKTTLIAT